MNRASEETLKKWMHFEDNVRHFFIKNDYIEVRTPFLCASPGIETYLEPFGTTYFGLLSSLQASHQNANHTELLYLPTSPEFHLKKAMAAGLDRIFEIKTCFRNGEVGPHHQPEFTMLEWYRRSYGTSDVTDDLTSDRAVSDLEPLQSLINETVELIKSLSSSPIQIMQQSVSDLFHQILEEELKPSTTADDLKEICKRHKIQFSDDDQWDELFHRIWLEKIECQFQKEQLYVVTHFPPPLSALAKIDLNSGWALRFEVYWKGLEIANAYDELQSVAEYEKRFSSINSRRISLGKQPVPIDHELMKVMESGAFPHCVGIALGMDRLFMALNDIQDIRQTRLFPK